MFAGLDGYKNPKTKGVFREIIIKNGKLSSLISISFNFIKLSSLNFSKNIESNLQDLYRLEHKTITNRSSSES